MKRLKNKLEYIWDMYFAWIFYNGYKQYRYYQYINNKYGRKMETQSSIGADMGGTYPKIDATGNSIYETCVSCGKETNVLKSTHIDFRTGYVEGAGQLCFDCWSGKSRSLITIDERTILDTPNDAELGYKIRQRYWESQK